MAARRALAAVPDQPGRAVLYVRVSALMGRDEEEFHSPALQVDAMRQMVGSAGLREVAVVDDDIDVSGTTFSRRGLDRIRELVASGRVDVIALYDLSRLGRDLTESLNFIKWLRSRGVVVMSAQERIDDSPEGQYMLQQFLGMAELRAKQIGRGWSNLIAKRARDGHHHGRALGYVRRNRHLHPDPVLGPVIARAWRDYAAGVPIGRIAAQVADARGRPMVTSNLKTIFRNPVYLGHVTANGQIVARDAHRALVEQGTWDRVQDRLARDAGEPPRHLEKSWALVGLCFCPDGHRLQRWPSRYRGELVERLVCGMGKTVRGVHNGCAGIGTPRLDAVEAEVLRRVARHIELLRTDHVARAERLARRHTDVVDAKRLREQLGRTRDAVAKLAKAWALGDLSDAEYHQPVAELKAEAMTLEGALAAIREPEGQLAPREAANAAEALLALWTDPEVLPDERNRALRTVVRRITVRRAGRWREPEAGRVTVEFV